MLVHANAQLAWKQQLEGEAARAQEEYQQLHEAFSAIKAR